MFLHEKVKEKDSNEKYQNIYYILSARFFFFATMLFMICSLCWVLIWRKSKMICNIIKRSFLLFNSPIHPSSFHPTMILSTLWPCPLFYHRLQSCSHLPGHVLSFYFSALLSSCCLPHVQLLPLKYSTMTFQSLNSCLPSRFVDWDLIKGYKGCWLTGLKATVICDGTVGGTVVQWLTLLSHREKVLGCWLPPTFQSHLSLGNYLSKFPIDVWPTWLKLLLHSFSTQL